ILYNIPYSWRNFIDIPTCCDHINLLYKRITPGKGRYHADNVLDSYGLHKEYRYLTKEKDSTENFIIKPSRRYLQALASDHEPILVTFYEASTRWYLQSIKTV